MTEILELRKSNLVLPTSGYELDCEEMCYVEGGIYLDQGQVDFILRATVGYASGFGISTLVTAFNAAHDFLVLQLTIWLSGFGAFLAIVGKLWFVSQVTELAKGFVESIPRRKGIDIGFGFSWIVIPGITCKAR